MITKQFITCCLLVCLLVTNGLASYTYEVYIYGENKTLTDDEMILVDLEGGMDRLTLYYQSSANIIGTSTLGQGIGGIGEINLFEYSSMDFSGGELGNLDIFNDATAILSGGSVVSIESNQIAWQHEGDPHVLVPNPHITIVYSGDLPTVDTNNVLTGLWGDGSAFSIYLHDISGFSPAIENIQFIPEPATLILLGVGGLLIRRKK